MSALKEQNIIPPESWIGTGTPDMPGGEAAMVELLGRNLQRQYGCWRTDSIKR